MAHGFRRFDRDQALLLPPDMREWLPADHEVWAVVDAVEQFDLSAFMPARRADGKGRAGYHPALMVGLLLYAYALGVRSSRRIERLCEENVAFRVLTGDQRPDHATIARFRVEHAEALQGLHVQVLALCARAGLVRLGVVALDSTKVAANASRKATRGYAAIAAQVAAMHAQAAVTDAAEDAEHGAARGDQLPEPLRDRSQRRQRFAAAKARIEADTAVEHQAWQQRMARRAEWTRRGKKPPGRPITQAAVEPTAHGRQANTTDPDSRLLKCPGGWVQGYSAQAMATVDHIVIASEVTAEQNDSPWLHPLLDQAQAALAAADVAEPIAVLLADRGYYSDANVTHAAADDPELLIATVKGYDLDRSVADEAAHGQRRTPYRSKTVAAMIQRLASDDGRTLYRKRQHTIEPVFGDIKHNRGIGRFSRRGLAACQTEWSLICTTGNLMRWTRRRP